MCWQEQTSTTNSNILKINILVIALCICELHMRRVPSSPYSSYLIWEYQIKNLYVGMDGRESEYSEDKVSI